MFQPTSLSTHAAGSIYRTVSSSSGATRSTDFSTACRCLLDGEPFTDSRDALKKILLSLRSTDKPGIYVTPDAMNEGRITLNLSVAGEAIVTVSISGEAPVFITLTPVSQLWQDICNAPALAARMKSWCDWAGEYAPGENRAEALRCVTECMLSGCQVLDLSSLGLTSLPDALPDGLTYFDAVDNHLKSLPDNLPGSLECIYMSYNNLTCLPDNLPDRLTFLCVSNNCLKSLPDKLPAGLTTLDVSHNPLPCLPDTLPAGLTTLDTIFTLLTYRPDNLPAGVRFLALRNDSQNLMSIRG